MFFLVLTQQHIASVRANLRAVDQHAREAVQALSDLKSGQQAYVAAGQGIAFWRPKVQATTDAARNAMVAMRQVITAGGANAALDQASATMSDLESIDKRAREYMAGGETLMASDVVFTEARQAAADVTQQIETARLAEHEGADGREAALRRQETTAAAVAAAFGALLLLMLVPLPRVEAEPTIAIRPASTLSLGSDLDEIVSHAKPAPAAPPSPAPVVTPSEPVMQRPRSAPILKAAADLATEFGKVQDLDHLARLLARAADMMDASGLVVWIGDAAGRDLKAMLAHGYAAQMIARMPTVPRAGDNAAAAAYRTGALQIVPSAPNGTNGAIVVPILAAEGCVGALSAEIRDGGEGSEAVQALATIIAAHLAGTLGPSASETAAESTAVVKAAAQA